VLALAAWLSLCPCHAAEFTAHGVPAGISEESDGRISFYLRREDLHYWIEPRSSAEREALLESLRRLESDNGTVLVSFGVNGAGIPDGQARLEYRVEGLRQLAGAQDLYAEPALTPHNARPGMHADSTLDIALLRGVPLYYSRQLDEALVRLDAAVQAADDARADERWKKVLAYKTRGLTHAALAHASEPRASEDADRQFLRALNDLREWQQLQLQTPRARYEIGAVLEDLGAYREALGVYQGIGRDFSEEVFWPKIDAASAYRQLRDYPQALAALEQLSAKQRDSMPYHFHRGWILEASGRFPEAVREYTSGLESQPDYAWALLRRACAQAHTRQLAEARADDARAVTLLATFPAGDREIEFALEQATRIADELAAGAADKAVAQCTELGRRFEPRARSRLLSRHISWLPLSSTPRAPRGLYALTPTQFRLLVLAVLALLAGGTVVLVRRFATAR
jgi:tetratricopeptide (TPR) repeat protein